ncbi:MAG: tetratricopeptide repeat protein [Deltaproteobacteria bacterium]|nr:tetratricopeptide repeat protein [Deltaproteobacteria bacterium]
MMICLAELMRFLPETGQSPSEVSRWTIIQSFPRDRILRRRLYVPLILVLVILVMPSISCASTNQQAQEAINLLNQKEYVQALELLHDLETRVLNPDQVSHLLAVAYLGRGYQLLSASDFSAAREAFIEGRLYSEDDIRLWQGEAMTWFKQGQYAEAASLLDQAIGIAPQNADLYYLLGRAYYADSRMAEALDALTKSRELGGDTAVTNLLEKVQREWLLEQEMGQEVRGHFQLSYVDGEHVSGLASAILETLEDAYTELGSALNYYPDVRVPVLLYTRRDFSSVTSSPDWAGAVYDGKIRLPLGGMQQMTGPLAALLYHEYSHVLVRFLANRHTPVWLNEGLAELAGRRMYSPPLAHLHEAIEADQLISWDDLTGSIAGFSNSKARLAYEQSYSMVYFMVDSFGWHKMTELLERIGKRQAWQSAIAAVYQDYGLDWPAILTEWQAGLYQ